MICQKNLINIKEWISATWHESVKLRLLLVALNVCKDQNVQYIVLLLEISLSEKNWKKRFKP
jgi:hypothetical protein